MGKIFEKKILLVLGSNTGSDDIVLYAKENGAHTIVADYYPPERSSAKRIADEAVLISTADLDGLGEFIEKRHVDGVLAGVSEFNLLQAMELARRYHLPFYCSREQWDMVEDKARFRKLCEENGVPCPKTFYAGSKIPESLWPVIHYPAVIKPVDASSSAGVHICFTEEEMREAENDALSHSSTNSIIVEEHVFGEEFTALYSICNGVATLSSIDQRLSTALHSGHVTTIPLLRLYPPYFLDAYISEVNTSVLKLCHSIGIQDGVFFIQGFYNKNLGFRMFEGGLRSEGTAPYRFLDRVNGVNYLHLLVEHSLLGRSVSFQSSKEDPYMHGKYCALVAFITKGGVVGKIDGLEQAVANVSSVVAYENRYPVGRQTPDGDTLRQIMMRFVLVCDSKEQMKSDIAYLNENVKVFDDKGNNMVIKMDPKELLSMDSR